MLRVVVAMQHTFADSRGATAVEYGLLVTFIALVIITAAGLVGSKLITVFTNAANAL